MCVGFLTEFTTAVAIEDEETKRAREVAAPFFVDQRYERTERQAAPPRHLLQARSERLFER